MHLNTPCDISTYAVDKDGRCKIVRNGKSIWEPRWVYCRYHKLPLSAIDGLVIRHKCDVPNCRNPLHLETGTQADNVKDMHDRGRALKARGEKQWAAKATEATVINIRADKIHSASELAAIHNLAISTVCRIINRQAWKHVE